MKCFIFFKKVFEYQLKNQYAATSNSREKVVKENPDKKKHLELKISYTRGAKL